MGEKTTIILVIGILLFCIVVSVLGAYLNLKTTEEYLLSDYSCRQIELSIVSGKCLPQTTTFMFRDCFDTDEIFIYYKLFCEDK